MIPSWATLCRTVWTNFVPYSINKLYLHVPVHVYASILGNNVWMNAYCVYCMYIDIYLVRHTLVKAMNIDYLNAEGYIKRFCRSSCTTLLDRAWCCALSCAMLIPMPVTKTCPGSAFETGSSSWHSLTVTGGMGTKQPDDNSMGDGKGARVGQCTSP